MQINEFHHLARNVFPVFIQHRLSAVRAQKYKLFDLAQVVFRINTIKPHVKRHTGFHEVGFTTISSAGRLKV
jgi:hypothetical protein